MLVVLLGQLMQWLVRWPVVGFCEKSVKLLAHLRRLRNLILRDLESDNHNLSLSACLSVCLSSLV